MMKNDKNIRLALFTLHNITYAIIVNNIFEIIAMPKTTFVPNINKFVIGAINFKNKIIPVFSLTKIFGIEKEDKINENKKIIIINYDKRLIGIEINNIIDIFDLPSLKIKTVMLENINSPIEGIGEIEKNIFFLLNVEKLITTKEPFKKEVQDIILNKYKEAANEKNNI